MKIEINLTNRWLYSLIAVVIVVLLIVGVKSYNSGASPSVMGHSGEEIEVTVGGETKLLNEALEELGTSSMTFEVYNPDTTTYACEDKNLKDYCGDEDGCVIRVIMQHETLATDQVRVIDEHIFMEHPSMSNNRNSGTYGYTRQEGGGEHVWITGTQARYEMFSPWDQAWMFNYRNANCPGQSGDGSAWDDHYKFTFMSGPSIRTKIIVYD